MINRTSLCFTVLSLSICHVSVSRAQSGGWSIPSSISEKTFSVDFPAMSINGRGEIYVVWESTNQPPSDLKAQLFLATFNGERWLPPLAITDTGRMDWTPDIATDTLGNPHVVWEEDDSSEVYYQWFDGSRWSIPQNVSQDSGASYYPRIAIDHKNRVHVVWHDNTFSSWSVLYRYFDGVRWSPTINLSDTLIVSNFPRICIDALDNLHVTFHSRTYPRLSEDVFYVNCQDGIWSKPTRITMDSLSSHNPDIAVFKNELPLIVWAQVLLPWPLQRVLFSELSPGGWEEPAAIADTSESTYPSVGIDFRDNVHLVWELRNRLNNPTRIMYSYFSNSQWSPPLDLTGVIGGSGRPTVKLDNKGNCHVVWASLDHGIYYTNLTSTVSVAQNREEVPNAIQLLQNYPNPFNSSTVIEYSLPKEDSITLKVLDVLGREVKTLAFGKQPQGVHSITFEASELSSGIYFFQLRGQAQPITKKMVLIR